MMNEFTKISTVAALALLAGSALAHDIDQAGLPVCLESNYMMADAMNDPFGMPGPGRVIEMNIITGTPGITVNAPFSPANAGTDICPSGIFCDNGMGGGGPWKPTGVLSGGQNGHAFITSAAQQVLTEFHRDGTPIRSMSYKPLTGNPEGPAGFGTVPRPLGTQLMPNGNLIQAICDANFFNAKNSDLAAEGGFEADQYFPPVSTTPERSANSRLLVIDQDTLEVIDEYSQPGPGAPGHELWGCVAGIMFSDSGMYVSTFHGAAVLEIDWKAGIDNEKSEGVGSNSSNGFNIGKEQNRAVVTNVVDFRLGASYDDPSRRDSLRAISFDESGNIYATDRARSRDCLRGEYAGSPGGCNPSVFRQRVNIASLGFDEENPGSGWNDGGLRRSVALDPGVNVIAGIRTNRMSAPACDYVMENRDMYSIEDNPDYGYAAFEDLCDVETVLVASSAMNPGEILEDGGCVGGHKANACFKPGGGVAEYLTHPNWTDGGPGWAGPGSTCSGDPTDLTGNTACAQPVATFEYTAPGSDTAIPVDPRMLMVIHEAFGQ